MSNSASSSADDVPSFPNIFQMTPAEIDVVRADVLGYLQGLRAAHFGFETVLNSELRLTAAITSLLVWDILGSFDREVHYVWKARWSYAKVIFFVNRYLPPITFIVEAICETHSSKTIYQLYLHHFGEFNPSNSALFWTALFWTPRALALAWVWLILCTVSATNVSFVLGVRLWALYERNRRVLTLLGAGFLGCFVPAWTLTFKTATTSFEPSELRTFSNVYAYMMGVVMEDGPQALNWPLIKCYRFRYPKISTSIIVASFLYESGIFVGLVWKMLKDQKKTKTIEAFYRDGILYYLVMFCNYGVAMGIGFAFDDVVAQGFLTSAFYIGIKSVMCSHIILRLRSYFGEGDPIIDGQFGPDQFADEGKVWDHQNSSSRVSTIIQFAHMLSGSPPNTVEIRSGHLGRGTQPTLFSESASEEKAVDIEGPNTGIAPEPTSPHPLRPHTPAQRQKLDWFDTATPPADPSPGVLETVRNRGHHLNTGSRSTGTKKAQRLSLQLPRYPNSSSSREESSVVMEMEDINVLRESGRTEDADGVK